MFPLLIMTFVNAEALNALVPIIRPDGMDNVPVKFKLLNAVALILVIPSLIVKLHPVSIFTPLVI